MEFIIDSIRSYMKKRTNYAVMLNGRWGSGKTFFWENILRNEIESIEAKGGEKYKTIYISLYGVETIDEINKKIFLENVARFVGKNQAIKKLMDSKWGGRMTETAKMLVNTAKGLNVPFFNIKDALEGGVNYENLLDLTNTVLCFDDLERANLEITDILGYINNFVEHDGVKVIIISNEKEISERLVNQNIEMKTLVSTFVLHAEGELKQSSNVSNQNQKESKSSKELIEENLQQIFDKTNDYKRIKEKLIGKTYTYTPDYSSLISSILEREENEELKLALSSNTDLIKLTFAKSGTENIRILKQALDDFETIYSNIEEKFGDIEGDVLSSILLFTLAISFEIKSGAEYNQELEKIDSNDSFFSVLVTSRLLKNSENKYLEKFREKYFSGTSLSPVLFYKFIEILVRKGIFDSNIFEREMQKFFIKKDSTPVHVKLLSTAFWELTDDEFNEAVKETFNLAIHGEIEYTLYFQAFIYYRYFIKKGLFKMELPQLKEKLMNGLKFAGARASIYHDMGTLFYATNIQPDDHDLLDFKEEVFRINEEVKRREEVKMVSELMDSINKDFRDFLIRLKDKFFSIPVFAYYDIATLFDHILRLSNPDIFTLTHLLKERYELVGVDLKSDYFNLKLLKTNIDDHINRNELTLNISLLSDLSNQIGSICDKLEDRSSEN